MLIFTLLYTSCNTLDYLPTSWGWARLSSAKAGFAVQMVLITMDCMDNYGWVWRPVFLEVSWFPPSLSFSRRVTGCRLRFCLWYQHILTGVGAGLSSAKIEPINIFIIVSHSMQCLHATIKPTIIWQKYIFP